MDQYSPDSINATIMRGKVGTDCFLDLLLRQLPERNAQLKTWYKKYRNA